jgi:ComF family protein
MWTALSELLYPEKCPACDALGRGRVGLCDACVVSLYAVGPACPRCALPEEGPGVVCRRCARLPPPFERVVAPWRFGGELAVALRRLKFGGPSGGGRRELARPLATLWSGCWLPACDVVVPVPLHPARLRVRGFGQAQALAEAARALYGGPPVDATALVRVRATAEQARLGRAERRRNVAGAFVAAPRVAGRRVILCDDVVTTGATAAAAARALRAAGARAVTVLALARADR